MNVSQALDAADEGEKEGLLGLYPTVGRVLAAEVRHLQARVNQQARFSEKAIEAMNRNADLGEAARLDKKSGKVPIPTPLSMQQGTTAGFSEGSCLNKAPRTGDISDGNCGGDYSLHARIHRHIEFTSPDDGRDLLILASEAMRIMERKIEYHEHKQRDLLVVLKNISEKNTPWMKEYFTTCEDCLAGYAREVLKDYGDLK